MAQQTDDRPENHRRTLVLDFDGTISSYSSGWKGVAVCPDPPVAGAMEFIREAMQHFDVHIYSARSSSMEGRLAMYDWLLRHYREHFGLEENDAMWELTAIRWPLHKPYAFVSIDDRAIQFCGVWPSMETLKTFKPWNRQ